MRTIWITDAQIDQLETDGYLATGDMTGQAIELVSRGSNWIDRDPIVLEFGADGRDAVRAGTTHRITIPGEASADDQTFEIQLGPRLATAPQLTAEVVPQEKLDPDAAEAARLLDFVDLLTDGLDSPADMTGAERVQLAGALATAAAARATLAVNQQLWEVCDQLSTVNDNLESIDLGREPT